MVVIQRLLTRPLAQPLGLKMALEKASTAPSQGAGCYMGTHPNTNGAKNSWQGGKKRADQREESPLPNGTFFHCHSYTYQQSTHWKSLPSPPMNDLLSWNQSQ